MRVGALFPQNEIGTDPGAIREYAVAAEELGYRHLLAYDHVIGADRTMHTRLNSGDTGPYTHESEFHEPFVLFGYLAALTKLELVTAILILPQRQTALVAKQAAELSLLSEGNLRLGIGAGWNFVEFEALNEDFNTRGKRMDEQIHLLRKLWSGHAVSFSGDYHRIEHAGINPLPLGGSIPIWVGGRSKAAYRRIAREADGWFPREQPGDGLAAALSDIAAEASRAGRDPSEIQMEGRATFAHDDERFVADVTAWREAGASHLSVDTMGLGLSSVDEHVSLLERAIRCL